MDKINWRSISEFGLPINDNIKYLVTDGKDISTTEISVDTFYEKGKPKVSKFRKWAGDDNTYEDNNCCSGVKGFYMKPTHWCPINEIQLP